MKALPKLWFFPVLLALALPSAAALAQGAAPAAAPASTEQLFNKEQLDQMMAPVALYPDSLLAQLFMACTYPSSVAEAAQWSAAHPDDKGDAAVAKVENQNWDPAVKSLVAFPQVLVQLKDQPDWVQKVGDAFLAQPKDVMDSVQRLRAQAQKAGNLKSNEQQKVVVQQEPTTSTTVIEIQPTNPEVVYVPSYNPTVVYGSWAYPSYPPPYWPPPPYYYPMGGALAAGIMWGTGLAIANNLWGGCNWGHGDVNVNVNKYNNVNRNNQISGSGNQKWNHNADNRRGTPYADKGNRDKYGQQDRAGANNRQDSRGRDTGGAGAGSRDAARQRSAESFNRASTQGAGARDAGSRGSASAGSRDMGGGAGPGSRGGAAAGSRDMGGGSRGGSSNAFSGASSPSASQRSSSRGSSSMSSRPSGGGGGSVSRSAPSRGGGGGGRRR